MIDYDPQDFKGASQKDSPLVIVAAYAAHVILGVYLCYILANWY